MTLPNDMPSPSDNAPSLHLFLFPSLTDFFLRIKRPTLALALALFLTACSSEREQSITSEQPTSEPAPKGAPPPIDREFRGLWIPTVANICWPSKRGLTTDAQRAELISLLDRAADLNLNAVVLQIRPASDALYQSELEPWSEYLTGTQGQAPSPYYDPLDFAIAEAHKRGLELHAWFNPFRVRSKNNKHSVSKNHISQSRPDLVRDYGSLLWLDPGEPEAQDHTVNVVLDVVKRYDIDAVHLDDYFYPYPEKKASGAVIDFPDSASWKKHGKPTGLSRDDWRRLNVDQFVERLYQAVHDEKPHVKVGISPFGIWRPQYPAKIQGLDAYDKLYADSRKWLREGWCDYLVPQLYWPIDPPPTSFSALLEWWNSENIKKRHVWPGLNSLKVDSDWEVSEISRQIDITRNQEGSSGAIHWNANALIQIPELESELKSNIYRQPALVPKSTWLDDIPPESPTVTAKQTNTGVTLNWTASNADTPWQWVVQFRESGKWETRFLPSPIQSIQLETRPDTVAVTAIDRTGNESIPMILNLEE